MESIERLRKWITEHVDEWYMMRGELNRLFDAIEEDVERLREKIRNQRRQLEEVQDALHRRNEGELKREWQREIDALYHELLVTKLESIPIPKDDDGRLIQHNDRMEWPDGKTFTVIGFGIENTLFYIDDDGSVQWTNAKGKRHHEEDVRDVLREMLCAWEDTLTSEGVDGIISEYAERLQLKEPSDD